MLEISRPDPLPKDLTRWANRRLVGHRTFSVFVCVLRWSFWPDQEPMNDQWSEGIIAQNSDTSSILNASDWPITESIDFNSLFLLVCNRQRQTKESHNGWSLAERTEKKRNLYLFFFHFLFLIASLISRDRISLIDQNCCSRQRKKNAFSCTLKRELFHNF